MPPGEGDRFRDDTKAGRYRCVLPICDGLFWVSAGEKNAHHWRHRTTPSVEHSPETMWHIAAKTVLVEFARAQQPTAVIQHDDKFTPSRNKPDVWVHWPARDGSPPGNIAFEAQHSAISTPGLKLRNARYENDGIVPVWLFSHLAAPVRSALSGYAVEVRLNEAHKIAADTAPLRWFNPDERTVATAYVRKPIRPDLQRGEVWQDEDLERVVYTRPAQRGDASVWIALDPLDDCTLDASGLHTPTDLWIEREAALAAEQEKQALADYLAVFGHRHQPATVERGRYGPAEIAPPGPRQDLPPLSPASTFDPLAKPCVYCGGTPVARTEWPYWYRPPAGTTEVAICSTCDLVIGRVL